MKRRLQDNAFMLSGWLKKVKTEHFLTPFNAQNGSKKLKHFYFFRKRPKRCDFLVYLSSSFPNYKLYIKVNHLDIQTCVE